VHWRQALGLGQKKKDRTFSAHASWWLTFWGSLLCASKTYQPGEQWPTSPTCAYLLGCRLGHYSASLRRSQQTCRAAHSISRCLLLSTFLPPLTCDCYHHAVLHLCISAAPALQHPLLHTLSGPIFHVYMPWISNTYLDGSMLWHGLSYLRTRLGHTGHGDEHDYSTRKATSPVFLSWEHSHNTAYATSATSLTITPVRLTLSVLPMLLELKAVMSSSCLVVCLLVSLATIDHVCWVHLHGGILRDATLERVA